MTKSLLAALALLAILSPICAEAVNQFPLKPDGENTAPATVFGSPVNGVSVGTTTPPSGAVKLKVEGDVTVSGSLTAGSIIGGGGACAAGGGSNSVLCQGSANTASGGLSVVGGGNNNIADGPNTTVGGGRENRASNGHSTVPGGRDNVAGADYSYAHGRRAKANNSGSWVWADSIDADFASIADNDFSVRAGGGSRFVTPTATFSGSVSATSFSGDGSGLTGVLSGSGAANRLAVFSGASTVGGSADLTFSSGLLFVRQPSAGNTPVNLFLRNNAAIDLGIGVAANGGSPYTGVAVNEAFIDPTAASKLHLIGSASASRVTFDAVNNRLGVNNTAPAESLDVVGNATVSGTVSAGGGSNIVYYCTGSTAGTFDGNLARGNSNAGACSGGTWVATSLRVD